MDTDGLQNWRRLGEFVRKGRTELGFTNRENFSDATNVSARVLHDLESGSRSNYSDRVLGDLEEGLGWPSGTIDQIIADPEFVPPPPRRVDEAGGLVFRPPNFDRRPAGVEVASIERSIATLTEVRKTAGETKLNRNEAALAGSVITLCWPYITRLVEDNCLPAQELHPGVRPIYETFLDLADWINPADPVSRYVRWLSGDAIDVMKTVEQRYMQRWSESRRAARGRRTETSLDAETAGQPS